MTVTAPAKTMCASMTAAAVNAKTLCSITQLAKDVNAAEISAMKTDHASLAPKKASYLSGQTQEMFANAKAKLEKTKSAKTAQKLTVNIGSGMTSIISVLAVELRTTKASVAKPAQPIKSGQRKTKSVNAMAQ